MKKENPLKSYAVIVLEHNAQEPEIFSSIIAADAVNQVPFDKSVKKASNFIKKCILKSIEMDIPVTDGVCFEELLQTLKV